MSRKAFTVTELLVSMASVALLLALVITAVQGSRESARTMQCAANLRQISVGVAAYESAHGMFPPGSSNGASLHVAILPFIDQQVLFQKYNGATGDDAALRAVALPVYACPSESAPRFYSNWPGSPTACTNYVGNFGTGVRVSGFNGMFRLLGPSDFDGYPLGPIRPIDVRDGLSQTAAVSEILIGAGFLEWLRVDWNTPETYPAPDEFPAFVAVCDAIPTNAAQYGWMGSPIDHGLPWTWGSIGKTMYNHALPPNRPSCINGQTVVYGIYTATSLHRGGVNVAFADGHVDFINDKLDRGIWRDFGSRVASDLPK